MKAIGPFTCPAVGATTEVSIGAQSGLAVGVEVTNLSGNLLRIQIGPRTEWLPAFRIDRFPMGAENVFSVTNVLVELTGAVENRFLVTAAYLNDADDYLSAFPGTYPNDVVRSTLSMMQPAQPDGTLYPRRTFAIAVRLSKAVAAGGIEHFLSIYQDANNAFFDNATQGQMIRITRVAITVDTITAATVLQAYLAQIDNSIVPAGGTVRSPILYRNGIATVVGQPFQSLPTTKGNITGAVAGYSFNAAISAATADPSSRLKALLYQYLGDMIAEAPRCDGSGGGWVIEVASTVASTITAEVEVEFTVSAA